jgi:hypothetical protein
MKKHQIQEARKNKTQGKKQARPIQKTSKN